MTQAVINLLGDDVKRNAMRKRAYLLGREMIWSKAAERYMESFEKARRSPTQAIHQSRLEVRTLEDESLELPAISARSSYRASPIPRESCSMPSIPCPIFRTATAWDDNAQKHYVITVLLRAQNSGARSAGNSRRLSEIYASSLQYAFNPDLKRFRNFMGFNRD